MPATVDDQPAAADGVLADDPGLFSLSSAKSDAAPESMSSCTGSVMSPINLREFEPLADLVRKWADGSIAPDGQDRLIRIAGHVVQDKLHILLTEVQILYGYKPELVAVTAAAPLFLHGTGPDSTLGRAWLRCPPGPSSGEVVDWFESRVVQTAKRGLVALKGADRKFPGVVRCKLVAALRDNPAIRCDPADRKRLPEYVRMRNIDEIRPQLPRLELMHIRPLVGEIWNGKGSFSQKVELLVRELAEIPERCCKVAFAVIYQAVLEHEVTSAAFELPEPVSQSDPDFLRRLDAKIAQALRAIDPVLARYVDGGRAPRDHAIWIRRGVDLYLRQWAMGQNPLQHECLCQFWPGLTRDGYRQNQEIRERFEYVVKIARKEFKGLWE
jgi:hypothetical protein